MTDETKPITVAELLEQLTKLPPDAYVLTEGCDCIGPCSGARVSQMSPYFGMVVLERDDQRETPHQGPPKPPAPNYHRTVKLEAHDAEVGNKAPNTCPVCGVAVDGRFTLDWSHGVPMCSHKAVICPKCDGSGEMSHTEEDTTVTQECNACKGRGFLKP